MFALFLLLFFFPVNNLHGLTFVGLCAVCYADSMLHAAVARNDVVSFTFLTAKNFFNLNSERFGRAFIEVAFKGSSVRAILDILHANFVVVLFSFVAFLFFWLNFLFSVILIHTRSSWQSRLMFIQLDFHFSMGTLREERAFMNALQPI